MKKDKIEVKELDTTIKYDFKPLIIEEGKVMTRQERQFKQAKDFTGDFFTDEELTRLCKTLDDLEWDAYQYYKTISGSFSNIEVYDYDDESISVELTFGIQNDTQDTVHTEDYTIDRETMEVIN